MGPPYLHQQRLRSSPPIGQRPRHLTSQDGRESSLFISCPAALSWRAPSPKLIVSHCTTRQRSPKLALPFPQLPSLSRQLLISRSIQFHLAIIPPSLAHHPTATSRLSTTSSSQPLLKAAPAILHHPIPTRGSLSQESSVASRTVPLLPLQASPSTILLWVEASSRAMALTPSSSSTPLGCLRRAF